MSRLPILRALAALGLLFSSFTAQAQVGTGAVSYGAGGASQNFDTLVSTGTSSTLPTGWYFSETGSNNNTLYTASNAAGATPSGDTYSLGATGAGERAFGGIQSGSLVPLLGARLANNSGAALAQLPVQYVGEQWRLGATGRADRLDFQYSLNATAINDAAATWVDVDALDFTAPVTTGTAGGLDGNNAANRTAISATITGLNVANGATITLRWADSNASGADDALGIDDVVFGVPVDNPPTVLSSVPAHNATGVSANATLSVTFSEAVNADADSFALNCGFGTPALNVSAGPAASYTLTPAAPLGYSRLCTLTVVGSEVLDLDGTPDAMAANETIQFETEADDLPSVVSVTPADQATDVGRGANLSVTFSEPVTAPASAFGIFCPDTAMSSLAFQLSSGDATTFTLDPNADLPAATLCRLYVDNLQITDQDGNADNPDRDSSTTFTTAAIAPPAVVSTLPVKNATDFPSAGDLQVVFDVSVTLAPGAFTLTCAQSTGIALTHAGSGSSFAVDTGTALVAGDSCTFTIEADAVTSGDGLHPDADEVVPFTVAGGVAPYYAQANTSSAAQLRCSLNEIIDGHTAYPYSASSTDTWDILNLADEDPVDPTRVLDVYKNERYTKITGGTGIYNREHTWPNTYGFSGGSPGAYTDVHMLHVTNTQYNSDRGSKPFADCDSGCTELPTAANYGVGGGGGGDSNYVKSGAGENNGSFEVWDHLKGNMARAMMYMVIRYEGENGDPDLELTDTRADITSSGVGGKHYMGLLTTLMGWHLADPVDAKEVARNELVYSFQNNRNPFVDHPEWGTLALMNSTSPASCTLAGGGNARPVGVDDLYAATQGALLTVTGLDGVLDNDTDAENDALTAALVAQAIKGTVVLGADGGFTYQPDAGTCGADAFTYQAADAGNRSSVTIARINVACSGNNPPVANDDAHAVAEDSGQAVVNVLANDTSAPDVGETLAVIAVTQGARGSVSLSGGVVRYTPNANANGGDSFTYTLSDGNGGTDVGTVNVTIAALNDPPTALDDAHAVDEDSGTATVSVLANDSFAPDSGETLTVTAVTQGTRGVVALNAGVVSYTPAANANGSDTFTYTISDGNGGSDTATVNVTIAALDDGPAVANDDQATVAEDSSGNAIAVLANDTADPDGGAPAVTGVGNALHGSTSFTAGGVGYTPAANYCGNDSFTYTVDGVATATVNVSVTCVNDAPAIAAPLAARDAAVGVQGAPFSVAAGFADVDGDDLDFVIAGLPAGMTFDPETGTVSGAPAAGSQAGSPYTVTVTASDGSLQVQQSFQLTVTLLPGRVFQSGFEGS